VLTGGAGADVFDYNSLADSNDAGRDLITDFRHTIDDINLATIDASSKTAGNAAFKFIGTQNFHGIAGELRYLQVNKAGTIDDRTIIAGDVNGDSIADVRINLKGLVTLSAGDFVL
jgi:serralysin